MASVKLKIAILRKMKGIGQQELAEALGVSFQSVSKWETGVTMPDITLLPDIAEYFSISVDELLGLKPIGQQDYLPSNTDNHDSANGKEETSSYTGIDNDYFVNKANQKFTHDSYKAEFIIANPYNFEAKKLYDIAIIQGGLRHMNKPKDVLKRMISSVKKGGLIICVDVNREFENNGFYIDGLDYENLCTSFDFHKAWKKELECEYHSICSSWVCMMWMSG